MAIGASWFARAIVVAVVTSTLSLHAAAQQTAEQALARQRTSAYVMDWLKSILLLPDDLRIDPSLRRALEALAKEHQDRMKTVVEQWVAERSRAVAPGTSYEWQLRRPVLATFMNEVTRWRLESPSEEYDAVLAPVLARTGHCHDRPGRSYLAQVALLLQEVPLEHRQTVLVGERELLARWGKQGSKLAPRPVPSLIEREEAVLAAIKDGREFTGPALPPVLANRLLVANDRVEKLTADAECALHAWGLRQAFAEPGATPREALVAYRYATAPRTAEWMPMPSGALERPKSLPSGEYPPVAATYYVEGVVTVRVVIDSEGRFKSASVIGRDVGVEGVPGRSVAFETLLDEASLARAATLQYPKPEAAAVRNGTVVGERKINWRLQ